ncbi:hypothetical protein F2P79_023514 [Pimephales promelas]|nr:hypothetical protein F2P79_023514 [Pimephales promelas]
MIGGPQCEFSLLVLLRRMHPSGPKPIMPRTYKRKTDRASTPLVELDRAVKEVQQGKTIRQVARKMKIYRMTLKQFMEKKR